MSNSTKQDQRIADELGKHRLASPSPGLQDRVLRAALQVMREKELEPDDISWKLPVFRFAACLGLGIALILAGNMAGNFVATQWQYSPSSHGRQGSDASFLAGLADAPAMDKLAAIEASRSRDAALDQLLTYRQQMQESQGSFD